jgi:hypothetical protein
LIKNEDEVTKFTVAYFVVIAARGEGACAENETASQLPRPPPPSRAFSVALCSKDHGSFYKNINSDFTAAIHLLGEGRGGT